MKKLSIVILTSTLLLFGCGITTDENNTDNSSTTTTEINETKVILTEVPLVEPHRNSDTCSVISQTVPVSNFPDDIPLYAGSNQTEADCTKYGTYYTLRYKTTDNLANVTDNLTMLLEQYGWGNIEITDRSSEHDTYDYYTLIHAGRPGGAYGRSVTYDVRDDLRVPGAGEILIREQYEN